MIKGKITKPDGTQLELESDSHVDFSSAIASFSGTLSNTNPVANEKNERPHSGRGKTPHFRTIGGKKHFYQGWTARDNELIAEEVVRGLMTGTSSSEVSSRCQKAIKIAGDRKNVSRKDINLRSWAIRKYLTEGKGHRYISEDARRIAEDVQDRHENKDASPTPLTSYLTTEA